MTPSSQKSHILVTLGPTWEFIDPVRFLTNRATGTLGYTIAREGKKRGYRVTCVAGPTRLRPLSGVRWIDVMSGRQMYRAVRSAFSKIDVLVMSAAVSDYRARRVFRNKLKRKGKTTTLVLEENPDIVGTLSRRKGNRIFVGFALETSSLLQNALKKLRAKKLDLIVANQVTRGNDPFGGGRVSVHVLWKDGRHKTLRRIGKQKIATVLLDAIEELMASKHFRAT